MANLAGEIPQTLHDLNSWWAAGQVIRPKPRPYRRRGVERLQRALAQREPLIQVLRGPRQVGKTTALHQIVQEHLAAGAKPADILLVRFDLPQLQQTNLLHILDWYASEIRKRPLAEGAPPLILFDEIHKLEHWSANIKHMFDTFPVRLVLTGSSSVLVAKGQRDSLAGRAITVDFPQFSFRETLECWRASSAKHLPNPISLGDLFADFPKCIRIFRDIHKQPAQRKLSWKRLLDKYYNRGGYPRLYEAEASLADGWANYLTETVFERVLGVDIPDLFPVQQPQLLRHIYREVARRTGTEFSQGSLTMVCNDAGFRTKQPTVGRYLHYLSDAMLIREFRRYPLSKSRTARVPAKMTLTDLGVRNAIFRGAPSLWESDPRETGPLVETLVQTVLRGMGFQTHFFRDFETPGNRKSPVVEVDFVCETTDGTAIPIEVKFRQQLRPADSGGVRYFMQRFNAPVGIIVTRDTFEWDRKQRILYVPILYFLLAF